MTRKRKFEKKLTGNYRKMETGKKYCIRKRLTAYIF